MTRHSYILIALLFTSFFLFFADKIWDQKDLIHYSEEYTDQICQEFNNSLQQIETDLAKQLSLFDHQAGQEYVHANLKNKYAEECILIGDKMQSSNNSFYWHYITQHNIQTKQWCGPVLDQFRNKRYFFYYFPHKCGTKGLVYSFEISNLYRYLQTFGIDRIGYGYLITSDGTFIAHPQNETRNYEQFASEVNESTLQRLVHDFEDGKIQHMCEYHHINTVTKKSCWEVLKKLKNYPLYLGISVNDNHVYDNPIFRNQKRKHIVSYSLVLVVLVLFIGYYVIYKSQTIQNKVLVFVLYFSFAVLLEIFLIVQTCINYPVINFGSNSKCELQDRKNQIIRHVKTNKKKDLIDFLDRWNFSMLINNENLEHNLSNFSYRLQQNSISDFKQIPTGIYLQTIKFKDSHSTDITGIIWQKYPIGWSEPKGMVFPEAERCKLELLDSLQLKQYGKRFHLYRWSFEITVREPFNFKHYPLDRNDLWLRMQHVNYSENIVLIPDFDSYSVMSPSFLPGIDLNVDMPGWILEGSFFSYKDKSYCTNFGNHLDAYKTEFPELHYNVMLHRDYNDPFVCKVIPLFVLLFMMFSILFIGGGKARLEIVVGCSGLFFVAIFEHIDLRQSLNASGIIYLEYLYFITYLLLLIVTFSAMKYNMQIKIKQFEISLIQLSKVAFWPLFFFLLLLVTIYTFY